MHPSFTLSAHLTQLRVAGGLESVPAVTGQEVGYMLDRWPVYQRADIQKGSQPFSLTFTPAGNLDSPINLRDFGL